MTGLEVVQQLMAEIGPRMELSEVSEFTEEESWVLVVDDQTVISADYDPDGARIFFSTEVAQPPAQNRARFYEQMLMFNHMWPETGGLRFALDGPAGAAVLSFDLPLDGLDIQGVEQSLSTLLEQLTIWRAHFSTVVEDSSGENPPDTNLPSGVIRV